MTSAIMVRFSIMDSGMLSAPDEATITVTVHDGPKKVDGALDIHRPLGDETALIPLSAFFTVVEEEASGTTYAADSKNPLVASAQVGDVSANAFTDAPAGPNLYLTMKSLGTTEIILKVMQAENTTTNGPAQELEIKFNLTVE